jgi:hypothetical protein
MFLSSLHLQVLLYVFSPYLIHQFQALSRLPCHLNMKSLTVSEDYRDAFLQADAAFRYQLVFDPLSCRLVHLNEPEDSEKVTAYAGKMLPSDTAYQLALGNLNPFTLEQVDNFNPHVIQQARSYIFCIHRYLICLTFKKGAYFCVVIHTELT